MQLSNFVHRCTTGGYCLRIKNYAGMRYAAGVIEYRDLHCEKSTLSDDLE